MAEAFIRISVDSKEAQTALGRIKDELATLSKGAKFKVETSLQQTLGGLQGVGLKLFALQQGFQIVTSASKVFYNTILNGNDRLERSIITTKALIATSNDIFQNGQKIVDPGKALQALDAPIKRQLSKLQEEGVNLLTEFPDQVRIFQTIAGQIAQFNGNLTDARKLTLSFAASLDALGLSAQQSGREIRTLLAGRADQRSRLATRLFGSPENANEKINLWKKQGTLVENLRQRMASLEEGARQAAGTVGGLAANIKDQLGILSNKAFAPFIEPAKQVLRVILEGIESLRNSVGLTFLIESLGVIINTGKEVANIVISQIGGALEQTAESAYSLFLQFVLLLRDMRPLLQFLGSLFGALLKFLLKALNLAIEGWMKLLGLIRQVGVATGLVAQDRTWDTGPTRMEPSGEIRTRVLSDEALNTPERISEAWKQNTEEIKRDYEQAMDSISLANIQAENSILESTDHTTKGQREAAIARAQVAIESAEQRLQIEQELTQRLQEQLEKQVAIVKSTEDQIAKLKEEGITQSELPHLEELEKQLAKEKALELETQRDILKSKENAEKEEQNLIKERKNLEKEARDAAIEGIKMQQKAVEAYYDSAISNQKALAQDIEQEMEQIQARVDRLNEQKNSINLDKEFEIKKVEEDTSLNEEQKKAKIQAITQEALKKEFELREKIFALEQRAAALAAKKAQIEAKRAVLEATKAQKTAELELQKARKEGDDEAIADAEKNLEQARQELSLAKEQEAFAAENIKAQKELQREKERTFLKEKRNAFQEAGLTDEAERINEQLNSTKDFTKGIDDLSGALLEAKSNLKSFYGEGSSALEKMSMQLQSFSGGIGEVNTGLAKMNSLMRDSKRLGTGSGGAGHSLNNLIGRAGQGLGDLMPKGDRSFGGRGGVSFGNMLGREGNLGVQGGTQIDTVNINFGQTEKATLIGAKSVLRGKF